MITLDSFRDHFRDWGQVDPAREVLVGYSGGADSTALLTLLVEAGVSCVAAHLHHGLRSEADAELALCEAYTTELGVPFVSGRADVAAMAEARRIGIEEAGRLARQEFFRQSCARLGLSTIATGHTQDDHIETILFRMARGTGLSGLVGIPWSRDNLVRPLRAYTRAETREFCEARGLWFHDDPANADFEASRVRLRERVVPELRLVHPGFDAGLVRLSQIATEEEEFLNGLAGRLLASAHRELNGNLGFLTRDVEVAFDAAPIRQNPPVLARRAMRVIALYFGATLSYEQSESVTAALMAGEKAAVTSEEGALRIEVSPDSVHVAVTEEVVPFRFPLTVPGETDSVEFGWTFACSETAAVNPQRKRNSLEVLVDRAAVKGNLYFRSAEPGDKMAPLGLGGTKLLADIMSDAKLTAMARRRLPVVCDLVGPVWVPGLALAERVKVISTTSQGLLIRLFASQ